MKQQVEILSPAGSYECLMAAIKSGADAVYVGGAKFGARAFANNFDEDELKKAIDYVHLHGKQLYLTVNTLVKEDEMKSLYKYLVPLYEHGLDAVIVQDLGVLQFIKRNFPDMDIHASTQMTITNVLGAKFLEKLGVSRVVTARELSFTEVQRIAKETSLEVEAFVHGALCYCYSGQCLYSSMIGGRSGNRGQCAQPCRLPYKVGDMNSYIMSLKDICTLEHIPELIESGVYSFKIEGRMKKPEYVASVTKMYRKYVDMYLIHGKKGFKVLPSDMDELRDVFNRGDFHNGYWEQNNGKDMITLNKPGHTGVPVIKVLSQQGRIVKGEVLKELNKGDILDILDGKDNYTLGHGYSVKSIVELSLRKGIFLKPGTILYRTRNQSLIEHIQQDTEQNKLKEKMKGILTLYPNSPATLHLEYHDITVDVVGEMVQKAEKQPIVEEKIRKQIMKTGATSFEFVQLDIYMDDNVFIPNQQLNQLRRTALEQLEEKITHKYRRCKSSPVENPDTDIDGAVLGELNIDKEVIDTNREFIAYAESRQQLFPILEAEYIQKIYFDCNMLNHIWNNEEIIRFVEKAHANDKKTYLAMPHIFRQSAIDLYHENWDRILNYGFDGMVFRNLESMEFLIEHNYRGEIIADHHVYIYNNESNSFWSNQGVSRKTNGFELTVKELCKLEQKQMELVIYGHTPMMVSAQCVKKTIKGCDKSFENLKIKDRINKEFTVKNYCDYCYNLIYNYCPTSIIDEKIEISALDPRALRMNFTLEDSKDTKEILDVIKRVYISGESVIVNKETTKGHFRRGIG